MPREVRPNAIAADVERGVHLVIYGQCYSLKNSKILARGRTIKHPKATAFERDFTLQVPPEYRRLKMGSATQPLRTTVSVWYPSHRQDLDCAIVYDCLQRAGVISNDRHIIEKHEYAHVDAGTARVEITVEEI